MYMKYKLGEFCEIVSGSTPKTSISEYWDGKVKWITPAELKEDTYIIEDSVRKITEKAVKDTGLTSFPEGTVILSSRAPIGKVAIAGCEMYCNQGFKNLICSDKIYNRYLYWFLRGKTKYLESLGRGATFKEISKQIVANIEIDIPDLCEQHKIVRVLERINKLIGLRQEESKYLDSLIKARFVELFIGKGYPTKTVDEVSLGKGEYGAQSASIEYDSNRPRYVRITDIKDDGTLNDDIVASINPDDDEQYRLEYGDFMFARMGATVGKTYAFITGNQIFAGYLIRYRLNTKLINPRYLFWYTKLDEYWDWVKLNQSGAAQPGINAKKYGSLRIPIPPIELQQQFAAFVAQTDKSKVTPLKATKNRKNTLKRQLRHYNSTTHHTQGGFPA